MPQRISLKEKISYGLGDTSANIFMGMTMMFLTVYYTDVFKLNPAAMGTLFLISRIIDALSDPLIGVMADKTKNKLGKYRPWLLWFAVPYGLSCAAVFFTPDLSGTMKTVYAYITYICLILSFSLVIVPYVSLLGAISEDSDERISINAYRFPLAKLAYIICSLIVPALITLFANEIVGYRVVMSGIGLLCTILILICCFNTKERVSVEASKVSLKEQLKSLLKNDQALYVYAAQVVVMIMNTLKFGAMVYFIKYALGGTAEDVSFLLTAGSICGIIAPFIANNLLSKKLIGRINLLIFSQIIGGLILLIAGLFANDSINTVAAAFILSTLFAELIAIIVWATVADCDDYGYKKFGIRIAGMISGGLLFATKLGMAIGGAIMGYILAYYGYDPETAGSSTQEQIFAYNLLFIWIPAICMIVAGMIFMNYKLDKNYLETFEGEYSAL